MFHRKALHSVQYQIIYHCLQDCSWVSSSQLTYKHASKHQLRFSERRAAVRCPVFSRILPWAWLQNQCIPKDWFHTPTYWSVISKNVFLQSAKWSTMLVVQQPDLQLNNGNSFSFSCCKDMICVTTYKKFTLHDQLIAVLGTWWLQH